MHRSSFGLPTVVAIAGALLAAPASAQAPAAGAQAPAGGAAALAKQLSNPVANLVSVPFQLNWDFGIGTNKDMRTIINFQPVMPFSLNEKWNLITRVIVPVVSQPTAGTATFGVSDILLSGFFSPAQPKGAIWGIGPVLSLPMSADPLLGTGKWSAGPTLLILKQTGPWTMGMLANQLWSFAGDKSRSDVSQTFLQPFLSYGTKSAVTFTLNTESVANWKAPSGEQWTVPIIIQISKVVRIGRRPLSVGFGAGDYVEKPTGGPSWKLRSIVTLLFPK